MVSFALLAALTINMIQYGNPIGIYSAPMSGICLLCVRDFMLAWEV